MKLRLSHSECKRPLAWQISMGTVAIMLATMILGLQYIQHYTMSILSERDKRVAIDQLQNAQDQVSLIYDSVYSNINLLLYDGDVLAVAREPKISMDYDYYSHVCNIYTRLRSMAWDSNYIDSIFVYLNDNALISTTVVSSVTAYTREMIPILQSDFYEELCRSVYRIFLTAEHVGSEFHRYKNPITEDIPLITAGCASNDTYKSGRRIIMININRKMIESLLTSCLGDDSYGYLLDENRQLLCCTDNAKEVDLDFSSLLSENQRVKGEFSAAFGDTTGQAVYIRDSKSGLTIVKYIPDHENRMDAAALERVFLLVFILCNVIALIFVRYWIFRCLKPLDALCRKMEELELGRLGVQLDQAPRNELGNVIRHFNRMSLALAKSDEEKRAAEKALHTQEILALRAQLNPHFIFNVLNMLKWMAISRHADDLEECIVAMAEILYPVFREKSGPIPLRQEIYYLEKYLLILGHQFGSQINLDISLDPALEEVPIPLLSLQPIVENCVRHGYRAGDPALTITVTAQAENGALTVSITDNGRGIEPERLRQIRSSLEQKENIEADDGSRHIGLSNVHRRLVLNYGPQYGLTIQSTPGKGTTVMIRLPIPENEISSNKNEK